MPGARSDVGTGRPSAPRRLAGRAARRLLAWSRSATPLGDGAAGWVVGDRPVRASRIEGDGWLLSYGQPGDPWLETHALKVLGQQHVGWLLERFAVDLVLDVGANVGQFAQSVRDAGYTGRIVSFEPVPQYADALERVASSDPAWSVRRTALGSAAGTATMRVQREFSSILAASDYGRERFAALDTAGGVDQVEVPVARLDAVLAELAADAPAPGRPRVYLKLDTQGYDVEVFRGLGARVDDVVAMQSEASLLPIYAGMPRLPEALTVYEQAGFALTGCYPVSREADGRVIEYDCTFVRTGALAEVDPAAAGAQLLY